MTSWMREEPKGPSEEDYLLGRAVDKNFEQQGTMGQINAVEYDCTPESIFSSRVGHQVDLDRKMAEDPLMAIRKQEMDTRKKVLDNPIKMKQIQEYIKKSKKEKKKKKKKKKKHKGSDSESEGSGDDEDLDLLLLQKLEKFDPKDVKKSRGRSSESPERKPKEEKEKSRRRRSRSGERQRSRSREDRRRGRDRQRSRSRSKERRSEARPQPSTSSSSSRSGRSEGGRARDRPRGGGGGGGGGGLSEEEKARRLAEMSANASWREEQRSRNVAHHRAMDEREEDERRAREHDPQFIRKQLQSAAADGSVEKRLQSNRHNIQRGHADMDKNFARR